MERLKHIITNEIPQYPYPPYIVAMDAGTVDRSDLTPQLLGIPLGVELQNGRIPVDEAGLVQLGNETYACDHAFALHSDSTQLIVGPSCKTDVDRNGQVQGSGLIMLTAEKTGLIKIIGIAVAEGRNAWLNPQRQAGRAAIELFGLEARVYEPRDISDGIIEARLWAA